MKIVIINLKHSTDRFLKISNNLKELNLSFERFEAIYGKELSSDQIKESTSFMGRTFLCNRGIIGCAMSHIEIWKSFKNSNEDFIFITEDDVEYSSRLPKLLNNIKDIYEQIDFDVLSLNCSIGINYSTKSTIFIKNYEITKPFFPLTTASYILSKKGVDKLLSMITKINYHIDFEIALKNLFNDLKYFNIKQPVILTVEQSNSSNVSVINHGLLNKFLNLIGMHKFNWILSNTAFTLFLDLSISIYACVLIILSIICYIKKQYIFFCIVIIELILVLIQ
jgi:glycosyl transferase family 25